MDKTQTSPEKQKLQWAGSRETLSLSGRGRAFFLTSLFIELIDQWQGWLLALIHCVRSKAQ